MSRLSSCDCHNYRSSDGYAPNVGLESESLPSLKGCCFRGFLAGSSFLDKSHQCIRRWQSSTNELSRFETCHIAGPCPSRACAYSRRIAS
jgi:hypothetical protein